MFCNHLLFNIRTAYRSCVCRRCMALHRVECKAQTAEAPRPKCQERGGMIGKLGAAAKFHMFPGRPKIFLCIFDVQRHLAVLTVHFLRRCSEIHLTSEKKCSTSIILYVQCEARQPWIVQEYEDFVFCLHFIPYCV